MLSDHWFNPNIDVRKSGEGGWGSRSWRGGGVGIPIPLLSFICSVVNNGFQTFPWGKSFSASNFTSPLLSLCFSGFLAKSFFKSESVDPLCFSTLRALRVDVAPLMDDSSSFSPVLLESFTGLSFCNPWVGSKEEEDSTSKLSLTTWLFRLWYSTTTLGTSNTK